MQSEFIDMDRISEDALPFLAADLAAGERSIVASAFGEMKRWFFGPVNPIQHTFSARVLLVEVNVVNIVV